MTQKLLYVNFVLNFHRNVRRSECLNQIFHHLLSTTLEMQIDLHNAKPLVEGG